MLNYIVASAIIVGAIFCSDTPGKQPPCLHERIFAGQGTANGAAVSCPQYRGVRIGEEMPLSDGLCVRVYLENERENIMAVRPIRKKVRGIRIWQEFIRE